MSDELRERIAKLLGLWVLTDSDINVYDYADAVLDVLGLEPWGHWFVDDTPGHECNHYEGENCPRSHATTFDLYRLSPQEAQDG